MNKASFNGYIMILLSTVGFGSYGIWSRLLGQEFGIFYQAWVRSAIVLLVLIPIAIVTKSFKPVAKKNRKWIVFLVLFGSATQVPLYYAYNNMDIGTATLIFYAMYLITSYVVGRLFIGEKITAVKLLSLIFAFLGLALTFGFSLGKFSLLAFLLAAVNGIASGGEVSITKKTSQKLSSLQLAIYVWAATFITHLPLSLMLGERQVPFAFDYLWLSMFCYTVAGLTSFWLVIEGYKYVDASIGGLIGLLEIIFGIIFGIIFFREVLTDTVVLGGSLIIFSAMLSDLVALNARRKRIL